MFVDGVVLKLPHCVLQNVVDEDLGVRLARLSSTVDEGLAKLGGEVAGAVPRALYDAASLAAGMQLADLQSGMQQAADRLNELQDEMDCGPTKMQELEDQISVSAHCSSAGPLPRAAPNTPAVDVHNVELTLPLIDFAQDLEMDMMQLDLLCGAAVGNGKAS